MKVLVPIDDSPYSEAVLDAIVGQPWWGDSSFTILHVIGMPDESTWQDWGLKVNDELKTKLRAEALKLVTAKVADLKKKLDATFTVDGKVLEGHIRESIIEYATTNEADLIIMGSHGRTGLEKFFLGSVAEGVLREAPCSVEIVKSAKVDKEEREKKHKHGKHKKAVVLY